MTSPTHGPSSPLWTPYFAIKGEKRELFSLLSPPPTKQRKAAQQSKTRYLLDLQRIFSLVSSSTMAKLWHSLRVNPAKGFGQSSARDHRKEHSARTARACLTFSPQKSMTTSTKDTWDLIHPSRRQRGKQPKPHHNCHNR